MRPKASLFSAIVIVASACVPILGAQSLDSIQKMEASGDTMGARSALAHDAQASPCLLYTSPSPRD